MATKASGAQNRKAKALLEEAANPPPPARALASIQDLGPPPDSAVAIIAWANRVGAIMLWDVLTDPLVDAKERRRWASDFIAKVGLTSSKAVYEDKIARLEKAQRKGASDDVTDDDGLSSYPADGAGAGGVGSGEQPAASISRPVPDSAAEDDGP
jgi:hypothetical protein